jgi:hypothetical protein
MPKPKPREEKRKEEKRSEEVWRTGNSLAGGRSPTCRHRLLLNQGGGEKCTARYRTLGPAGSTWTRCLILDTRHSTLDTFKHPSQFGSVRFVLSNCSGPCLCVACRVVSCRVGLLYNGVHVCTLDCALCTFYNGAGLAGVPQGLAKD